MPTVVSLFSGCGGLDLGFRELGYEILYAADNDPSAVAVYRRNIGNEVHQRNVLEEDFHSDIAAIGSADVILGGFPCQGFSKAGPKNKSDVRNSLYLEMRRAVRTLKPKIFVAENVDGLSQNFGGSVLKEIVSDFEEIGYRVEYRIIDAVAYGVPQHRRRIIFIGIHEGTLDFSWPVATHHAPKRNGESSIDGHSRQLWEPVDQVWQLPERTMRDAIDDLPELGFFPDHLVTNNWPGKYLHIFKAIKQNQKLCNVRFSPTSVYTWQIPEVFGETTVTQKKILETIGRNRRKKEYGSIPNGNPLPIEEIARLMGEEVNPQDIEYLLATGYLKKVDVRIDLKGAMFCSGIFKRPAWDKPSPTILTSFHNPRYFLHPEKNRPLSLRECARLQGFPDSFNFVGDGVTIEDGYRLVGNAVPPLVSRAFAQAVLKSLTKKNKQI